MTDLGQVTNSVLCLGSYCQNICLSHKGITDLNFTDASTVSRELTRRCQVRARWKINAVMYNKYNENALKTGRKCCTIAKSYSPELPYPSVHQNYSIESK